MSAAASKDFWHGGEGGGVALEVTVLSAESLRLPPSYSPLPRKLRPYVSVSSSSSSSSTGVASSSGREHSWDEGESSVVVVPVGAGFLEGREDVRVAVLSASGGPCPLHLLLGLGDTQLGWCRVPAADVLDGLRPPRALRRLSYSLRGSSSGQCRGVVHLAVRVLGDVRALSSSPLAPAAQCHRVAVGVPISGPSAGAVVVGTPSPWGAWWD